LLKDDFFKDDVYSAEITDLLKRDYKETFREFLNEDL
jgi:hypothetical protein